ncbi:MAG: ArgE/DapE family deacylase [Dongiaceae bacterium]
MADSGLTKEIMAAVDTGFDAQLAFTRDLTAIPSLRGREAPAQDFMARAYRERGLAVDRWKIDVKDIQHLPGFSPVMVSYDDAWNVVGSHRPRETKGRSLILNGHIDVVPTGPADMWAKPPFEPHVEGNWLYGRGAGDMKAGLAAGMFALDALRRVGYQPAADVYLQSVVEEECTGNGALACLQRGYRADAALIPEPTSDTLVAAQVGVMWFQVKIKGRPVHVSVAGTGANAIEAAYPIMAALHELEAKWNADKHAAFHAVNHPLNFVVSRIEGGDWTSSVPAWCTFDMRIGIYPGMDLKTVREAVEQTVATAARNDSYLSNSPPEIVYHGFQAEGYVLENADEPIGVLERAHGAVTGAALEQYAITGTTDARFFGLYADIPALVYGPASESIHGYDERVDIASTRRVTQAIALFMAEWCGLEKVAA